MHEPPSYELNKRNVFIKEENFIPSSTKPMRIEDRLISVIMKYRNDENQFFEIKEREEDRANVNSMYSQLYTLPQKILDSRCYLEFGKTQQKQTIEFLADDTTPEQRLKMLAYIVRTVRKPIIFLSGKSTLLGKFQEKHIPLIQIKEQPKKKPKIIDRECITKEISIEEITRVKKQLQTWMVNWPRNSKKLQINHAEILSQMAANHEIIIPSPTNNTNWVGTVRSIVIQQS